MNESGKLVIEKQDGSKQIHYIIDIAEILLVIGFIVLCALFGGEPDIADGIIHNLMK